MSMKTLLIATLAIGGVVYTDLNAQRGGGGGGARGGATGIPGGGRGGMPTGRIGNAWDRSLYNRPGRQGLGYMGYGWGYGANGLGYPAYYSDSGWPATYGDENQAPPSVVVVMPAQAPPEPPPPPPPPEPARPVVHDYTWPGTGGDPHATFSLVSRDGLVRRAVAVWVQDNQIGYTAADGSSGRLPQAVLDCGTTNRLNAENKLRLSLPGCRASQ
jgi:hypothetical protein